MKQYLELIKEIQTNGEDKKPARENMPGTRAIFGHQFRVDLAKGFPLFTTKKVSLRMVATELIWFLRGETNIKFLVDNKANFWNQDAYNFYLKKCKQVRANDPLSYEDFIENIKEGYLEPGTKTLPWNGYKYGDCGFQYGRVWTDWESHHVAWESPSGECDTWRSSTNQIWKVLKSLKETPESRRHIVSAIDPAHDDQLALYWCHCMFQFNTREIPFEKKLQLAMRNSGVEMENLAITEAAMNPKLTPQYYLDCQFYQRSADVFFGVPFNTASYALLVHIFCELLNMKPGHLIHTFGDAHIYDNLQEEMKLQFEREPRELPKLHIYSEMWAPDVDYDYFKLLEKGTTEFFKRVEIGDFTVEGYDPHPAIEAKDKLSTGLKK